MEHVFWLVPGRLAGRSGPDRDPWDVGELRRSGIDAILSVNDGAMCHREDFAAHGIRYACVPLSDNAPPRPGDEAICERALPRAYAFLRENIDAGRTVLVHCSAGKDRTGLVLAYWLVRTQGCSAEEAVARVREVRPIALNAECWEELGLRLLRRVE